MSESNQEWTGLHRTIERPQPAGGGLSSKPEKRSPKQRGVSPRGLALVLAGGLLVAGGMKAWNKYDDTRDLRHKNQQKIDQANKDKITDIEDWQSHGVKVRTLGALVVLMEGTKIRSSMTQANEKVWGWVPGNVSQTVGKDSVVIFTNPVVQTPSAEWIQASPYVPPTVGDFQLGSAKALAAKTRYVNLTGVAEQGAGVICNQTEDGAAFITKKFGYADKDGHQTAYVTTMPAETFAALVANGTFDCTDKLN